MAETLTDQELNNAEIEFKSIIEMDEQLAVSKFPDKKSENYYKEKVALLEMSLKDMVKQRARWESLAGKWEETMKRNS